MTTDLLTLDEAADRLRLSRRTLARRIAAGDLAVVKLGTASASPVRVEPAALDDYLARHRRPATDHQLAA
jgi:excisionase family DNA binding protein